MLRFIFPLRFRQWLGPLIVAGAGALILAVIVILWGLVNLSAALPHPEGWARFLHFTFERSTAHYAKGIKPPADLDSPIRVAAGAAYYGQVCSHCHSGPGLGQNPVALSMHPRPQYLVTALPISAFEDRELFRIVKDGVKYSAMPSWPASQRDDEVWNVVAFLRVLPKLSPEQFRALALPVAGPAPAADHAFGPMVHPTHYALRNDAEPPIAQYSYGTPDFGIGEFALSGDPVATCTRCHGADGAGGGAFPNLTIQTPSYIAQSLSAFAHGTRQSAFMRVVASQLSPKQIEGLATYYAGLPRRASEHVNAPVDPLGRQLALVGDKARNLGPCAGCHGVTRASAKAYPLLEGQSRWYLANQMRVFRAGGRGGIEGENPMPAIASRLSDREIEAVSAYFAAQPPSPQQSFAAIEKGR